MTSWLGRHPNFSGRKHFEAPACVAHGKEIGIHALSVAAALLPNGTLDLLDVQDEMLENLKRRANKNGVKNIVTTQGDAQALPYSDQMFDAEIMIETLGEISDHAAALSELRRVLKPGGRLVVGEAIIDPDYISLSALEEKVRDAGFVLERTTGPRFSYFARFRPVAMAT